MKATEIRQGDWIIAGTHVHDCVAFTGVDPYGNVAVINDHSVEYSIGADDEVSVNVAYVPEGHRFVRPIRDEVPLEQLQERVHRLARAAARHSGDTAYPETVDRIDAIIATAVRLQAAINARLEPDEEFERETRAAWRP